MLRNLRLIAVLFAASAFDSSPGGLTSGPGQPQPDPNVQSFDANANPEQSPAASSGFPTSTSTGKGEKSYQEAIGQQEGHPTGNEDVASTEPPQTTFDPEAPLGRTADGIPIQPD